MSKYNWDSFNNADKERADDAEAMFLGATVGLAKGVAKLKAAHANEIAELEGFLDAGLAAQLNWRAGRDAHKHLNEVMVAELNDPEGARRFSAPEADLERGRLLQDTHRQSWEESIKRNKAAHQISPEAIVLAREKAQQSLREYRDEAIAAQEKRAQLKKKPPSR